MNVPKYNIFLWVDWFLNKNISNLVTLRWKLDNPYYIIEHCLVELYQFSDNDTKILAYYHASRACLVENLPCLAAIQTGLP